MFKKVIIAEDFDSINHSVEKSLLELSIPEIANAQYCDDVLLKIKKAAFDKEPFELLITDLSFKTDHRSVTLASGEQLIAAVKKDFPEIKIIVLSVEDRSYTIKSLFEELHIDGYIVKGRHSLRELKKAVAVVYRNETFLSEEILHVLRDCTIPEIGSYEKILIHLLAEGLSQEEIVAEFKKENIRPNSSSSIEKNINKLKTHFRASNNIHLIAMAKDFGMV